MFSFIKDSLSTKGYCLTKARTPSEASLLMIEIVSSIGHVLPHNSCPDSVLWDVRPFNNSNVSCARSHGSEEFQFHTDASFEKPSPRFIGMAVHRSDKKGGGLSKILSSENILRHISGESRNILKTNHFKFRIPNEFRKSLEFETRNSILFGDKLLRYRRDIIEPCNSSAEMALNELNRALHRDDLDETVMKLEDGDILFLDNARYLHSRTEINDLDRHLTRLRFQISGFES
eukprot:Pompholyxophrys_punicea_v1_NODE_584_length_1649_cov_2.351317.p1 type:complete len:232 gc:universal NODE_584_length_1649_cov_2.351317:897-1592(+)